MNRLVLGALLLAGHPVAADCMRVDLGPALLTPSGAALPSDGGLLVGWKQVVNGVANDDPAHPTWQFSTAMVTETLAPSLVVHRPKAPLAADLVVRDAKGAAIATYKRGGPTIGAALAAPKVSSVALTAQRNRWSPGRTVTAALVGAIPDPAVAIIGYVTRNGKSVAIEFAGITDHAAKAIETFADPGHCGFLPSGLDVPAAGETMTFAYVDQFGRVGKATGPVVPVTVKAAP